MFEDRYERGYWRDYGYGDSDEGRWDFTAGLEQLERWFAELLDMAADGEWIDASVGLLLTLQRLNEWARETGDEDIDGEDLQDECVFFWTKAEQLTQVIRDSTAPDSNKSAFFLELIDWIAGLCEKEEDWTIWKEPLSACLFSQEHYKRLEVLVKKFEPQLFADDTNAESVNSELVRWWVQASLDAGYETEAEHAEKRLGTFDAETSACFAHYYELLDRNNEAIARLQSIIRHVQEQIGRKSSESFRSISSHYVSEHDANRYFEWLISIYDRTNRQPEVTAWRVQWFETLPSLELFKLCLEEVLPEGREHQASAWIAHVRHQRSYGFENLLIDMYLHLNDPDQAWSIYEEECEKTSHRVSSSVRQLFEVIKQHDPKRLVPVISHYTRERIAEKNRKSYQRAAEWLAELKSVYLLLDQAETWVSYLRELRENHRRLPALQDEINRAGL